MPDDQSAILARDAKRLFAGLSSAPAIVLAVSGGPDSIALMWLAARWRRALARGPRLVAVTVDHGLRPEAAREARDVKRLARSLDLPHHTLRWSGPKPGTGLPAAAREARYRLLAQAARKHGATHILTAHTRDDQAETLLMRLLRGSGIAGLSAMARETARDGVWLTRPLLEISKADLIATLKKARIGFADDPTNRDPAFTRPRLRALMPMLAEEGGDARNLARLAARIARANAALEVLVDGAEHYLALKSEDNPRNGFDAAPFAAMPEEIRLRLLKRVIDRTGHEGPAELGKVETLLAAVDEALGKREPKLKQTLAGAVISVGGGRIRIGPAPPRRARSR
ncbi:tRNA lysidine(34) synthetase TilS [Bradyrhizobium septentrionale]|uniref:tRNA(Ile)-lysidine synthase n=1 Tax=Bradyrhizobium septentrionale TaxID=1404411 RepID=A0A973W825_9BRAD|nr:tRNA lysidine(34) synthetase TilS [Bradyrhizobium septentrionale]UGY17619.1 tRNA lysidine(34) synthetase TilS [Bradyrhizobium septentrionale]UGY26356.1 tRNA lysidine(34) synthetase TilS [Bradyrhizobium septentrionale]